MSAEQVDGGITPREVGEWHGDKLEYGRIPFAVTTDPRIGADAFRLWAYMATVLTRHVADNPSGRWELSKADCCRAVGLTEHRWTKAVAELTAAGLYLGKPVRAKAGAQGWNRTHSHIVAIGGTMLFEHHVFLPGASTTPEKIRGGRIRGGSIAPGQALTYTRDIHAQEMEAETHTPARARGEYVPSRPQTPEDRFAEFWATYPIHSGEAAARRVWRRRGLDSMADALIRDVRRRTEADRKWCAGYAPAAATYLGDDRWRDPIERPRETAREVAVDMAFRLAQ